MAEIIGGLEALMLSKRYTEETVEGAGAIKGKSAYEIAVDEGYSGTEEQWLESLKGAPGDEGPQGPPGEKGEKGDKGEPGAGGMTITYDSETETASFNPTTN